MAKYIADAVREICLSFPRAEEVASRGSPNFRVHGKTFAIYCINHHGDGRVALWLDMPEGAQAFYTQMEPDHYFIPPYVGPKGWLGVELNKRLSWTAIAERVQVAYERVAPAALSATIGNPIEIIPPDTELSPAEIDPLLQDRAQVIINRIGSICVDWPEVSRSTRFGCPVWKAGNKTFVCCYYEDFRLQLQFWVGVEAQEAMRTFDDRYNIPAYTGHNGWIDLDVENADPDWEEVERLLLISYRHFALKRMLKALDQFP